MKFIWRTDVHFSDHTPKRRKDDWRSTVAKKLEWIGKYAKEIGAKAVIDGGDFFDVKIPAKNSHYLINQSMTIHQKYPCPVYSVFGNHDARHSNVDLLDEQPLGVLYKSKTFKPLLFARPEHLAKQDTDHHGALKHTFYNESHEVTFEENGLKVRWVGIPYHGKTYHLEWINQIQKKDEDYLFVAAHLLASPRYKVKGSMFGAEDILGYEYLKNHTGGVDAWFFGHWHEDQGIVNLNAEDQNTTKPVFVVNIGSLTRGSLSIKDLDHEQERLPSIAVVHVDENGLHIEKKLLDKDVAKTKEEVFNIEQIVFERQIRQDTTEIQTLFTNVINSREQTLEEMISQIEGQEEEVAHRLRDYIDEFSKKDLK